MPSAKVTDIIARALSYVPIDPETDLYEGCLGPRPCHDGALRVEHYLAEFGYTIALLSDEEAMVEVVNGVLVMEEGLLFSRELARAINAALKVHLLGEPT